jgi:hypothetical protein
VPAGPPVVAAGSGRGASSGRRSAARPAG